MSILNPFGTAASSGESLPIGAVILWAGTLETIPTGWHLCNGEDGTIDLRGMFALGAGGAYSLGDEGGSEEVTLDVSQIPSHNHVILTISGYGSNSNPALQTKSQVSSGSVSTYNTERVGASQPHPNMPPYKALYYIQKIA